MMPPIDGPTPPINENSAQEIADWHRRFDADFFPSDKEMLQGLLGGIALVAAIILIPALCASLV
jgi:hypothetical protein